MTQFGTRRTASPHSLGSTASSGNWNRMGAHRPCSAARRYPTRSTRALASMAALYDAKRARLNNKLSSAQLRKSWCGKSNARVGQARSVAIREMPERSWRCSPRWPLCPCAVRRSIYRGRARQRYSGLCSQNPASFPQAADRRSPRCRCGDMLMGAARLLSG